VVWYSYAGEYCEYNHHHHHHHHLLLLLLSLLLPWLIDPLVYAPKELILKCESYRQWIGLLWLGISPSQGCYIRRTTQTMNKADRHPRLEWEVQSSWGLFYVAVNKQTNSVALVRKWTIPTVAVSTYIIQRRTLRRMMKNGKGFVTKSRDLNQVLFRHFPEGTEENHRKPVRKKPVSRVIFETRTSRIQGQSNITR
jgi:hypothetical protein